MSHHEIAPKMVPGRVVQGCNFVNRFGRIMGASRRGKPNALSPATCLTTAQLHDARINDEAMNP